MDRPDETFDSPVSSTPLVELLRHRCTKFRTISGPKMMYLDDAMVRAVLHTRAMDQFARGMIPANYRHIHAFYGALPVRRGDFVAVRARRGFWLARAMEDCFIMRCDPLAFCFEVEWCECQDEDRRRYVVGVGRDMVLHSTVFHRFAPDEIVVEGNGQVRIADDVPDLMELSNDLY